MTNKKYNIVTQSLIIIGLIVYAVTAAVLISKDYRSAEGVVNETVDFVKSVCRRYDNYVLGKKTEQLIDVLNKAKMAGSYFSEEKLTDNDILGKFIMWQEISGIIVFDEKLSPVSYAFADDAVPMSFWEEIASNPNISEVITYPKKSYMDRVEYGGKLYNIAVSARAETNEMILCFDEYEELLTDDGFNMDTLFSGFRLNMNGAIVVSDGEKVITSNISGLQGLSVSDCPVTDVSAAKKQSGDLIRIKYGRKSWYGTRSVYGDYIIYAFFPASEVFSNHQTILGYVITVYAVMCFFFEIMRYRSKRKSIQQIEEHINTVNAVSAIYTANVLVRLDRDEWHIIKAEDKIKDMLGVSGSRDKCLEIIKNNLVSDDNRAQFEKFTDLSDISERLSANGYTDLDFKNRENVWLNMTIVPRELDDNGRAVSVLLLVRNINEAKCRELDYLRQLKETAELADRANIAKTDFLRRMSHDIRTPINGIRGMAAIGKCSLDDPKKQEECLDKILTASDFLLDLVNNVLDMNKLESGNICLENKSFDLHGLIRALGLAVETQAVERGISYSADDSGITHSSVMGSPLHLRQVLQNIVSNAIKYNRESGSVRLICKELSCRDGRAEYEFICRDTGIGMSEEFQKHVFEPFSQEHSDARTQYEGTGLGLSIVKEFVELMGGTIDFESVPNKGTTFTVHLTLSLDSSKHEKPESSDEKPVSAEGIRVLVAEDNELNMEIAEFLLESRGLIVTKAKNGREAVDIFEAEPAGTFDVILMDIMMPVMNGLDAAKRIRSSERSDGKDIPIIAMTANAFVDDIQRSREAGMNEHLSKPLDIDMVIAAICRCVHKGD